MKVLAIDNGNSGNNGVMAMVVALCHNLPAGWELTVSLDNPYNEAKDGQRFLTEGIRSQPNLLGFMNVYMAKPGIRLLFPFFALVWLLLQKFAPKILPSRYVRYQDYDVVVSLCGEDFFSDNWSLHNCLFRFFQCICALSLHKKLVVLAQTFGPFQRRWSRAMARFCMRHATLVTARDHRSYEEILALVGASHRIRETRDLAFLLKPSNWKTVLTRHSELAKLPPRFAVISVSRTFAVNVLLTNGLVRGIPEHFHDAMAKCLDDFVIATQMPVVFVPQVVVGPSGDDRAEAEEVFKRMGQRNKAFVCRDEYTAGDLKALIGQSKIVVACRMHAQVAAVSQGIPLLALAYSPKSLDVIGKALEYEFVLDTRCMKPLDFARQATDMMIKLSDTQEETTRLLLESMPEILRQSYYNIDLFISSCSSVSSKDVEDEIFDE